MTLTRIVREEKERKFCLRTWTRYEVVVARPLYEIRLKRLGLFKTKENKKKQKKTKKYERKRYIMR